MGSKKRKRGGEKPTIHPRNKYAENPPDFAFLASLYPTFQQFVFYTRDGRPRIDWTDFNATRELTRVLLLHDHGLNWWIPDGQLCPTVPSRSNYIHWIEDLLASDIIPSTRADGDVIKGFDIGTGANCIYPLLGASLLGWRFVGSDVTEVALEWAEKNVKSNPHISELIEIRRVSQEKVTDKEELHNREANDDQSNADSSNVEAVDIQRLPASSASHSGLKESYHGPPVLLGVVGEGEKFDFCMCNPPFFESIVEAGLNPKTACGGTPEEMVCPGGEQAFITCIIEDSIKLKQSFRWYTSMLGRKSNLKALVAKLWDVGVTIVKTTEFVQGQTSRWGLAWSFVPPVRKTISSPVMEKSNLSFMLEGVQRQYSAIHVLQSVESYFSSAGASCKLDSNSFHIDVIASKDQCDTILKTETQHEDEAVSLQCEMEASNSSNHLNSRLNNLHLRISVFQQIPGTLLVKGSMQQRESPFSGAFSLMFQKLEGNLRSKFCREKGSAGGSSFKHKRDQHTY